jgi:hypothetical protein
MAIAIKIVSLPENAGGGFAALLMVGDEIVSRSTASNRTMARCMALIEAEEMGLIDDGEDANIPTLPE